MDPKIRKILAREKGRQKNTIELIASENFTSKEIMSLTGSVFTNKYAEGYPGKRWYNGCKHMDEIESLAIEYAKELFCCDFANVQPHSGAHANAAVLMLLNPGDNILGMDLSAGGHLTHGSKVSLSGKWFNAFTYGVNSHGHIDYHAISSLATKVKPKLIIAGASAYSRTIYWDYLQRIARDVDALLMADIAHYAGLIAAKVYPSPVGFADIITSTTHKTLRGPRGGLILTNNAELAKKLDFGIFPGIQGGPHMNTIAAKAQCFYEALKPEFVEYAKSVLENAKAMANVFEQRGIDVVSRGTDCHMILLDFSKQGLTGKQVADALEEHNITVNKNSVPNDIHPPTKTSGIRIGTAAETTRGHDVDWFEELANKIVDIIEEIDKSSSL